MPTIGKLSGVLSPFNLRMATGLGEGKILFKPMEFRPRIDLVSHSDTYIYIYIYIYTCVCVCVCVSVCVCVCVLKTKTA